MTSRISFNIHAQMVKDVPRLKKHLLKIQPATVLVLDGLGLAKEIKAALPNCIVIHRNYGVTKGDDDVHKRVTPQQWLDLRAKESEGGIYLYTTNEPDFDVKSLDWHIELMRLAGPMNVKLVIGNWAVGNPGADDWGRAKQMLELLDRYRDRFILGLHEYACGIITSGLYGGYPDNAGVYPGTPGGQNLIPKDNWPADVSKVTMFHCGRFKFLLNYCQNNNIQPPRIILTEHGMDDVSDIKGWAEKLEKTSPYLSIRGWKSLRTQWERWFKPLGWSPERSYFEQLAWADRVIYRNTPVEGQCIFSWGHSSNDWDQFDIAEASEFQDLLEAYAQKVDDVPKLIDKPMNATIFTRIKVKNAVHVRFGPGTTFKNLAYPEAALELAPNDRARIWLQSLNVNGEHEWVYINIETGKYAGYQGWVARDVLQYEERAATREIPPVQPPVTPPPPPIVVLPTMHQYTIPLVITVTALSQEAAEAVAEQALAAARFNWQMLNESRKVIPYLDTIKDVQFTVQLPKVGA